MISAESVVTLIVSEWWGVAPGIVALVCPDVGTARRVARALRNAVRWRIVPGEVTAEQARALGSEGAEASVLASDATASTPPPAPALLMRALER